MRKGNTIVKSSSMNCSLDFIVMLWIVCLIKVTSKILWIKQILINLLIWHAWDLNREAWARGRNMIVIIVGHCKHCCVMFWFSSCSQDGPACQLLLCGWKGKISCRSFIPKFERGHFLRLCGVELVDKGELVSAFQFCIISLQHPWSLAWLWEVLCLAFLVSWNALPAPKCVVFHPEAFLKSLLYVPLYLLLSNFSSSVAR